MNQDFNCLLVLDVPEMLETAIVDWLLDQQLDHVFTHYPVQVCGHDQSGMTALEKVNGRKQEVRFEVLIHQQNTDTHIQQLVTAFEGAAVRYRVVDVLQNGQT
jgi:hypothetical protein